MHEISVLPLGDGWKVRVRGVGNDLVFHSGRQAEATARRLAERLTRVGAHAELRIHLRDGSLAGRFVVPPALAPAERERVLEAA